MARIRPDNERCRYTTRDGKRCRSGRLPGDHGLCYFHYRHGLEKAEKQEPYAALVADEILPAEEPLDTPQAVNAALTRVFRLVTTGRLAPRHASALGYLGQLILTTLPHMERAAAAAPKHRVLGRDPDASIEELAQTLRRSVAQGANGGGRENPGTFPLAEPVTETV